MFFRCAQPILESFVLLWVRRPQKNYWWETSFYCIMCFLNWTLSFKCFLRHFLWRENPFIELRVLNCCRQRDFTCDFHLKTDRFCGLCFSLYWPGFAFTTDAQVLRSVLRQPLGHQKSLCRVLHDGLQLHLSRGATCKVVPLVHQPHQWPVSLGKRTVIPTLA